MHCATHPPPPPVHPSSQAPAPLAPYLLRSFSPRLEMSVKSRYDPWNESIYAVKLYGEKLKYFI